MVVVMKLMFPILVAYFLIGCATNTGAISIEKTRGCCLAKLEVVLWEKGQLRLTHFKKLRFFVNVKVNSFRSPMLGSLNHR